MSNAPKIDSNLMKDQKSSGNGKKAGFAGILAKLGLGGGAASSSAGGGILLGGTQAAAGGGLLAGIKANIGIVLLTALGSTAAVGMALISTGNAPKQIENNKFFAKLGGDSATKTRQADERARADALQGSGRDSDGISSSLQHLVDANTGALGQVEGATGEAGESVESADSASASAEAPENTVEAPNNDWGADAAGASSLPDASKRRKLQKRDFKKRSSGASTKVALGGPAATGRLKPKAAASGKLSSMGSSAGKGSRSRSAIRGKKSVSRGVGSGASGQLKAHSGTLRSNLSSGKVSSAGSGAVMDGAAGRIGSSGAGASQIGGGGAGSGGGPRDGRPIVNPVTSKNTSTKNPPPPIKKGKDKTPYQKEQKMATMSLLAATGLLLLASMVAKMKQSWAQTAAKALAGLAMAAAAVAAMMGVVLMTKYKQTLQGGMFTLGAAVIMFQAGMVLTKEDAGAAGKEGVDQVALQKQKEAFLANHSGATPVEVSNGGGGLYYQHNGAVHQIGPTGSAPGHTTVVDGNTYWKAGAAPK
jgi:hypothetical protein